ncbi:MAG: hypothetical protein COA79_00130 [Planctomycetota bacterium]|nr:MAG: hypothetical protein COA79_00130 [Planctomycetota bacterium]
MRRLSRNGLKRQEGQGMAEYIILVIFIAVVAIGIVTVFGKQIKAWFGVATNELSMETADLSSEHATKDEIETETSKTVDSLK